jgi:hypothetical protein
MMMWLGIVQKVRVLESKEKEEWDMEFKEEKEEL